MAWDEASLVARLCYLCRQQQPPCGETATPSRTQSIYHKPASRRLCGKRPLLSSIAKPEGVPAFASSAFRLATLKDSKNDKQNKIKGTMTCCLLTSKQTFFSVAVVASKQTHYLSLIKESDFNTHGLTSTFIWQRKWRIPSSLQPYFVKKRLTFLEKEFQFEKQDWWMRLDTPVKINQSINNQSVNQSIHTPDKFSSSRVTK